jgi:hypothetical protein
MASAACGRNPNAVAFAPCCVRAGMVIARMLGPCTTGGRSVVVNGRRPTALSDAAWAPRVLGKSIKLSKSGLTYPVAQGTLVCSPI